jgi:hypothetical protein
MMLKDKKYKDKEKMYSRKVNNRIQFKLLQNYQASIQINLEMTI